MDSTDLFILMLLLNEINKINKISYSEFNEIAYGCYTNSGCLPKRLDSSKLSKKVDPKSSRAYECKAMHHNNVMRLVYKVGYERRS